MHEYITPNQTSWQQQGAYEYQTKLTQANMSWSLLRTMQGTFQLQLIGS